MRVKMTKEMKLKEIQEKIKEFNDIRGWSNPIQIKDLLLNLTEEIGEFWNKIKWVDVDTQMKTISKNKKEVENDMADMLYLVLKISYICKVDLDKAIKDVMLEYEKRFPIDKMKNNHGNVLAGGVDLK